MTERSPGTVSVGMPGGVGQETKDIRDVLSQGMRMSIREVLACVASSMSDEQAQEVVDRMRAIWIGYTRSGAFQKFFEGQVRENMQETAAGIIADIVERRVGTWNFEEQVRERVAALWDAEVERVARERLDAALTEVRAKMGGGK